MPKLSEINDKPEEFLISLRNFVHNPHGFLLIAGSNGNGKSFASRAIFEHFDDPRIDNKFCRVAQLNMEWQKTFSEHGHTIHLLDHLIRSPLLVLDDLGVSERRPSDAFLDFLFCIADERYENREKLGTIITTNLNEKTMRQIMGDAFVSRVSSGICVRWDGPDRRGEKF